MNQKSVEESLWLRLSFEKGLAEHKQDQAWDNTSVENQRSSKSLGTTDEETKSIYLWEVNAPINSPLDR